MLERRSALQGTSAFKSGDLSLAEERAFSITQIASPTAAARKSLGGLPEAYGRARQNGDLAIFRVAPALYWIIGPEGWTAPEELAAGAMLLPLSQSRSRLRLEGKKALPVLAKSIPVDLASPKFGPGDFIMTGLHHMAVTLYCHGLESFDLYVQRSFARSLWDWLIEAADA